MWPFKKKTEVKRIPSRSVDELKNITKVLFIDDKTFKVVDNIKEKDGWKNVSRIVMYSAESQGQIDAFHPAAELVDARLRKTASLYEFTSTLERLAKEAFCLDNCVKHLKTILRREFSIEKDETEITKIITELYNNDGYEDKNTIASAFNLSNAGSVASIIQLLLMPLA